MAEATGKAGPTARIRSELSSHKGKESSEVVTQNSDCLGHLLVLEDDNEAAKFSLSSIISGETGGNDDALGQNPQTKVWHLGRDS